MANLSNKIELYANRKIDFLKEVILRNLRPSIAIESNFTNSWNKAFMSSIFIIK